MKELGGWITRGYTDLPKSIWKDLTVFGRVLCFWVFPILYVFITAIVIIMTIGYFVYRCVVIFGSLIFKEN